MGNAADNHAHALRKSSRHPKESVLCAVWFAAVLLCPLCAVLLCCALYFALCAVLLGVGGILGGAFLATDLIEAPRWLQRYRAQPKAKRDWQRLLPRTLALVG